MHAINHMAELRPDCSRCFGLCCAALPFTHSADFAIDKPAKMPCPNLQADCRCLIHSCLREKGFKGCIAFECFGAGQKVSEQTFAGVDWHGHKKTAEKMFAVFPKMIMLHELLWYLNEALIHPAVGPIRSELSHASAETEKLTRLSAESINALDLHALQAKLNQLFVETSGRVWRTSQSDGAGLRKKRADFCNADLIGKNFCKMDLSGANFRGAYLIAADLSHADLSGADFIGADLRDANLCGANLTDSIFLTQAQLNSAQGDAATRLPVLLDRPMHWH